MSTQRLLGSLRQLPGLAEENVVIFDGFADKLAKKNDSLIHYLLSNPASGPYIAGGGQGGQLLPPGKQFFFSNIVFD